MTRPLCLTCKGSRVRPSTGGPVPCSHCEDGYQRGVGDVDADTLALWRAEERVRVLTAALQPFATCEKAQEVLAAPGEWAPEYAASVQATGYCDRWVWPGYQRIPCASCEARRVLAPPA